MSKLTAAFLAPGANLRIDDYPIACAWSDDSATVAVAGGEGGVYVVRAAGTSAMAATVVSTPQKFGEHGLGACAISWRPQAQEFSSAGQDGTIATWNADTGSSVWRSKPSRQWIDHLAWAPNGAALASASGRQLGLWQSDGCALPSLEPLAASANALAWSSDRRDLAAATHGGIALLRFEGERRSLRRLEWSETCLNLAFSPNGKVLASGTQEGSVHFWYLMNTRDSQMRGYGAKVDCVGWSSNSRYLATNAGSEIVIWDFSGRGPEGSKPIQLRGHTDRVLALAYQSNGPFLASAGKDWRLSLWLPGKATLALDAHLADSEPSLLSWAPDGRRLLLGQARGELQLFYLQAY
jgi:WD40 repeat protein